MKGLAFLAGALVAVASGVLWGIGLMVGLSRARRPSWDDVVEAVRDGRVVTEDMVPAGPIPQRICDALVDAAESLPIIGVCGYCCGKVGCLHKTMAGADFCAAMREA